MTALINPALADLYAAQAVNKADWSNGVKPVIEQAWCGKPGCMSDS